MGCHPLDFGKMGSKGKDKGWCGRYSTLPPAVPPRVGSGSLRPYVVVVWVKTTPSGGGNPWLVACQRSSQSLPLLLLLLPSPPPPSRATVFLAQQGAHCRSLPVLARNIHPTPGHELAS